MLLLAAVPAFAGSAKLSYDMGTVNAIIDSGITSDHPDLQNASGDASRALYAQSLDGSGLTTHGYGHGTHVAGLAVGNGAASTGTPYTRTLPGIAPHAQLVSLKALDSTGDGTDASVIAAIQQAIALKSQYNIRVINLSLPWAL